MHTTSRLNEPAVETQRGTPSAKTLYNHSSFVRGHHSSVLLVENIDAIVVPNNCKPFFLSIRNADSTYVSSDLALNSQVDQHFPNKDDQVFSM